MERNHAFFEFTVGFGSITTKMAAISTRR